MDKEFKITGSLLISLLCLSSIVLIFQVQTQHFNLDLWVGFLFFSLLLIPYILFSSGSCIQWFQIWLGSSYLRRFGLPLYILSLYTIFSLFSLNFNGFLFFKLFLWLFLPTLLWMNPPSEQSPFGWKELLSVLLLWIPIEFGKLAGFDIHFSQAVSIPALPFAAPLFGLYLFLGLRKLSGIGFSFDIKKNDIGIVIVSLLILSLLLIPLGAGLGFIRVSLLKPSPLELLKLILGIYFMVALQEELLFRGIIQNLLSKVFTWDHSHFGSLLLASLIFGLSHLNHTPSDWRYAILATIAGTVYGICYMKTGKTTVSAMVHCGVNLVWALLFRETPG